MLGISHPLHYINVVHRVAIGARGCIAPNTWCVMVSFRFTFNPLFCAVIRSPHRVCHAYPFVATQNTEHRLVGSGASLCGECAILTALSTSGPLAAVPPHTFVLATCTGKLGFYCIFVFLVIVLICWAGVGVVLEQIRRPTEVHDHE